MEMFISFHGIDSFNLKRTKHVSVSSQLSVITPLLNIQFVLDVNNPHHSLGLMNKWIFSYNIRGVSHQEHEIYI